MSWTHASVPPWEVDGTVYVRAGVPGADAGDPGGGDREGTGGEGAAGEGWPYAASGAVVPRPRPELRDVPLVPYHDWANRGPATMRVWLPTL
jgi:hypothetical protein